MNLKKLLLGLLLLSGLALGCGKASERVAPEAPRGPNERYYAVQEKLDEGGNFYLYADLKDVLRGFLDEIRPMVEDPQMDPQARRLYDVADKVIDRLGLYGIHDLGMSSLSDGDLYRNKVYVSSPDGRQGLLKIMGGEPHDLAMLDRASSATLAMVTADIDVQALYELITQLVADIGGEQGTAGLAQGMAVLSSQTGLNPSLILPALSGQINFLVETDASQKLFLPLGTAPLQVDSPRGALMIGVTDSQLYDALRGFAQRNNAVLGEETVEGDLHLTSLIAPPNPFWVVAPAIGFDGEFVYLSTHTSYIRSLANPPADKPALRQNPEFMALREGFPEQGNGMIFVSGRLGTIIADVSEAAMRGLPNAIPESVKIRMAGLKDVMQGSLTMRINEPGGVMMINRSEQSSALFMAVVPAATTAILAAIAVPNFLEAQERAKIARVTADIDRMKEDMESMEGIVGASRKERIARTQGELSARRIENKSDRARADMRSLATAMEAYNIDTNAYPAWSADPAKNAFGAYPQLAGMPTFANSEHPDGAMSLTTPIAYIGRLIEDPFAPAEGATYCYWAPEDAAAGWILWSAGPDGDYDLTLDNIAQAYDPAQKVPSPLLTSLTFDPTNGTTSDGDVWRVKQ